MVEVKNIRKAFGKREVLKDISFSANTGECVAIIGRNGCGKSTLLQIMAGITRPDSGSMRYCDREVTSDKKVLRTMCGYVPQENPLLEDVSVYDNLKLFGVRKEDLKQELLSRFELESILHRRVSRLSGGMKRRVSIACAVSHFPRVLLMDEPTTALDLYYKATIQEWMEQYRRQQGTIIITSHDEQEIMNCDRCFLMADGVLHELSQEEKCESEIRRMIIES